MTDYEKIASDYSAPYQHGLVDPQQLAAILRDFDEQRQAGELWTWTDESGEIPDGMKIIITTSQLRKLVSRVRDDKRDQSQRQATDADVKRALELDGAATPAELWKKIGNTLYIGDVWFAMLGMMTDCQIAAEYRTLAPKIARRVIAADWEISKLREGLATFADNLIAAQERERELRKAIAEQRKQWKGQHREMSRIDSISEWVGQTQYRTAKMILDAIEVALAAGAEGGAT